ncbi:MAG: sigma 54-interacting transcriptional regulator [Burkholderiales bacterium]|nr:sigma 54-interacting transcriptional regulator [Burkholderiales bacterium]MDE2288407.1 sigma 54-interacting transcriptional regulator [Burkholderiales bacterium]MDE2609367.1 sigma 54-interacting transcriptional regulator [Burkholderiales bacterium]
MIATAAGSRAVDAQSGAASRQSRLDDARPRGLGAPQHASSDYARLRLLAMRSLFETFECASEGTLIVDRDARIVWMNERYARRFGLECAEDAIGRSCESVIPHSRMREVVQSGEPILLDILEGEADPLVVLRLPIKDEHGQTIGAIGVALFDKLRSLSPLLSRYSLMQAQLARAHETLKRERRSKYSFASFVGTSTPTLELKRHARRAAATESPILLLGETGTGKELLAHAIHATSQRAHKTFVSVNLAAIPEALLEAEFFGAVAGAYTGADRKGRPGKFQAAQGGTLFLDEVGDMPQQVQAKLLRVLQEKEFEPLGSNEVIHADVRIIAATSRDLHEEVRQGRFRADLFYRLNVLTVAVPPLRDRLEDIEVLCEAIFADLLSQGGYESAVLSQGALTVLQQYDWPGNVRELRNVLERALLAADGAPLAAGDIEAAIAAGMRVESPAPAHTLPSVSSGAGTRYDDAMVRFERGLIEDALRECGGKVTEAARRLGIGRATLYKKMSQLGIAAPRSA